MPSEEKTDSRKESTKELLEQTANQLKEILSEKEQIDKKIALLLKKHLSESNDSFNRRIYNAQDDNEALKTIIKEKEILENKRRIEITLLESSSQVLGQGAEILKQKMEILAMLQKGEEMITAYLPLAQHVLRSGQEELVVLLKLLLSLIADSRESLEPELEKLSELSAKAMKRDHDNLSLYFSKEFVERILIARIKPSSFLEYGKFTQPLSNTASSVVSKVKSRK